MKAKLLQQTFNESYDSDKKYTMGKMVPAWKGGEALTITFVVTEDCNLRCKYCYITHKKSDKRMDFKTAKKLIDYILSEQFESADAIILEFIGGEPFIETQLIDQICDYFKFASYEMQHKWYWNYRINICTNGINYSNKEVQAFVKKNMGKLSIGITIDGTREKHDMQRVYPDGRGSYDQIDKSIPLWLSQMPGATKVTFASEDIKLLKDSIISLWEKGIYIVSANVVFEDVWKEDDDKIFEEQLKKLADYVLEKKIYNKYYCSLFDENIGGYYTKEDLDRTYCGAGKMLALGPNGNIYPCVRYKDYSLNNHSEVIIGNVDTGIDMEKVRRFEVATTSYQSDSECLNCEIARGCAFCQGFNYDDAETETNFSRAKYICKMQKARVRANDYYFAKLYNLYGIEKESFQGIRHKTLNFLLANDYVTYCARENTSEFKVRMDEKTVLTGLEYARENFFQPVFIHSKNEYISFDSKLLENYNILHIIPAKWGLEKKDNLPSNYIMAFEEEDIKLLTYNITNCILNISVNKMINLASSIINLLERVEKVSCNIVGMNSHFDEELYKNQLEQVCNYLVRIYKDDKAFKRVSLITDLCELKEHNNCAAGDKTFSLAPDGRIYSCSADYNKGRDSVGTLLKAIEVKNRFLYTISGSPLCNLCDAHQCPNCVDLNLLKTGEVNISPSYQCRKGHLEAEATQKYQRQMEYNEIIDIPEYKDPINCFIKKNDDKGYYKYKE